MEPEAVHDRCPGEMVLKAADLVAHGAPNSYTLNRKGQISSGKGGTSAGITLSARVMPLNEILPSTSSKAASKYCLLLEVHSCRNLRKADWAGQNDVYVQAYYPPQGVRIYEQKALPAPEMSAVIPQGPCEFPFVMPLRIDAPGSAEVSAPHFDQMLPVLPGHLVPCAAIHAHFRAYMPHMSANPGMASIRFSSCHP